MSIERVTVSRDDSVYEVLPDLALTSKARVLGLMGWLTETMSDTTIALVGDGALLRSRQFDMGVSG